MKKQTADQKTPKATRTKPAAKLTRSEKAEAKRHGVDPARVAEMKARPAADVVIHEAAPKPEPVAEPVAVPTVTEAQVTEARATVARLTAELATARTTLRDLTRSSKPARVPGVATPAQKEHGRKSWLAPCAEAPNGGPLWIKFRSPAALAAKASAKTPAPAPSSPVLATEPATPKAKGKK